MGKPLIRIQDDYWTGTKCLEYEMPWVVPGAVHYLDSLCKPTYKVLDIGSGGSTLFYARRCLNVVAVETNPEWYKTVKAALKAKNLWNVAYYLIKDQEGIQNFIESFYNFDLVSVDSVHGYSRSGFLDVAVRKVERVLVLDNYAAPELFDKHHDKSIEDIAGLCGYSGWEGKDFDDSHWCGKGTRVLHRAP